MIDDIPDDEQRAIRASAFGSAYAIHSLMNGYDDAKAAFYANNVADRAVMAERDRREKRRRP